MSRKPPYRGAATPLDIDYTMATFAYRYIFPAAFALLPGVMNTPAAKATILAIGLQESRFTHRHQIKGPAHGFWQFEKNGGTKGVLTHPHTKGPVTHVCSELCYPVQIEACFNGLEHNDVLACCFARLLLWTVPGLPAERYAPITAWEQYLAGWRPGKPHYETWTDLYEKAWSIVQP